MRAGGRRSGVARAVAGVALLLALAACGAPAADTPAADPPVTVPALGTAADDLPAARVVLVAADGSETTVDVRVAATADARARGLMGVTDLPPGAGMLFRFPEVAAHGGFWMKDTPIPLDIAFAADGEVVAVATMTPCRADPCPVTRPDRAYDLALEVPAGALAAAGIGPGARLRVEGEPPPGAGQ